MSPKMAERQDRLVLNVPEVAKILGISRQSAYDGIARGEIPHILIGRRILCPKAALDRLLDSAGRGHD